MNDFLGFLDAHEGLIAVSAIIVTLIVFSNELKNYANSIEQQYFTKLLAKAVSEDIPNQLALIQSATESELFETSKSLVDILNKVLTDSTYFKYTMPWFYDDLHEYAQCVEEIVCDRRSWKKYRSIGQQKALIVKLSKKFINSVNKVSKGRTKMIWVRQLGVMCKIRLFYRRYFIKMPNDRICSSFREEVIRANQIRILGAKGEQRQEIHYAGDGKLLEIPNEYTRIYIDMGENVVKKIKAIVLAERFFFSAYGVGKVGYIKINGKQDQNIKIKREKGGYWIEFMDEKIHKLLIIWKEGKKKGNCYATIKVRRNRNMYTQEENISKTQQEQGDKKMTSKDNMKKARKFRKIVPVIEIVLTVVTIFVAIYIPNKIAYEQNRIALFDKRYETYWELRAIKEFVECDAYLDETGTTVNSRMFYGLWKGEIQDKYYPDTEHLITVLRMQEQAVYSIHLLFEEITEEEKELCELFFNTYSAMTQRYVQLADSDGAILWKEFDTSYTIVDISTILDKLEKQLGV